MDAALILRKQIEEIVSLSDEEFELVQQFFKLKTIAKKEYLIKSGNIVYSEFFVVKGLLKAFLQDDDGKEYIAQFAMENWWISDYPAYKIQSKGDMCVQALEDCIVFEISKADRDKMCEQIPKMYQFHGTKAFNGYVSLQKRVLSMMKNSAQEKYELLLEQYPALFQRVSKSTIAHYLGVSRETLSRLVKK